MPLPTPSSRREAHVRTITMKAYLRDDGLFDIEGHLVDVKPFDFQRLASPNPVPAGQALHDLWVRLTIDAGYVVRDVCAASDVTPYAICREAEGTLRVLIGERIGRGWSSIVKERLRGSASCTHLKEMLIPLATTAIQGVRGLAPREDRQARGGAAPIKIDSCYAYGAGREIVRHFWPEHYKPNGE